MTSEDFESPILRQPMIEVLFEVFLRAIAAYGLLVGVFYWIRLIGVFPGPLWRFDTMPIEWQVPVVTLAALFPFAAIGLWMTASWGPVIWFICAVIETVMHGAFPEIYGERQLVVLGHIVIALFYVGFRTALFFQRRQPAD